MEKLKAEKVEVSVLGQTFTLRSDKEEAHLHRVAAMVNQKYEELKRQARTASTHELALLLALNLADELMTERADNDACNQAVQERTARALAKINAALQEPAEERYSKM